MSAHLWQKLYAFEDCTVVNIVGNTCTIPAGTYSTWQLNNTTGGASICPAGRQIDIDENEWSRLKSGGLAREVKP